VVGLFQVVPRDFIICRTVVASSKTCDPKVDIADARVTVHKHDIVVENEAIDYDEREFGQESDEHADEAGIGRLYVVVVEFE
jgi:hypothetical protein